jgi:hypothetical protein
MRRVIFALLSLLPFLLLASLLNAALIVVPDDAPTIQDAITGAASGDSILVRAGTYAESLALTGKDLTIFGESGAEATVITGNSSFRILEVSGPLVTVATVIEDLTLLAGRAVQGAGIRLSHGASLTLQRCRFLQNAAVGSFPSYVAGGAVVVGEGSTLLADHCLFQDNQAAYPDSSSQTSGGAIDGNSGSQIQVRHSNFINNVTFGYEPGFGGGISSTGSVLVEDSRFTGGVASQGGGIFVSGNFLDPDPQLIVRRCVFERNISRYGSAVDGEVAMITLENNAFFSNTKWAIAAVFAQGIIAHNTMCFGSGIRMAGSRQGPLLVANNIISNGSVGVWVENAPQVSLVCNDVWSHRSDNYFGITDPTGTSGNISADPLFCNAPARDFTLDGLSPCAPANSPAGCGLIGAFPVECGVTDVADGSPAVALKLTVIPNPVRGTARFELGPVTPYTTLNIFDSQGRLVEQLSRHDGHWSWTPGTVVPAGVYFARLEAGDGAASVKFLYLR